MSKRLTTHVYLTVEQKHDDDLPVYSLSVEIEHNNLLYVCDSNSLAVAKKTAEVIEKKYLLFLVAVEPKTYMQLVTNIILEVTSNA